jgi:hypothetical protein
MRNNENYCKWFCVELVDDNKYLFQSNCEEKRIVSKWQKFYKHIYKDNGLNLCPKCGKPITVGELLY